MCLYLTGLYWEQRCHNGMLVCFPSVLFFFFLIPAYFPFDRWEFLQKSLRVNNAVLQQSQELLYPNLMDAKRNCSRNWFVWRLFVPLSKDQLVKKTESNSFIYTLPQAGAVQVLFVLPCPL